MYDAALVYWRHKTKKYAFREFGVIVSFYGIEYICIRPEILINNEEKTTVVLNQGDISYVNPIIDNRLFNTLKGINYFEKNIIFTNDIEDATSLKINIPNLKERKIIFNKFIEYVRNYYDGAAAEW